MGLFGIGNKKKKVDTSSPSLEKVNLMKERVSLVKKISLEKNIPASQVSRVALVLDYSGSMSNLYRSGFVQELLERLMPLGIRFDDNEAIDTFAFHNDAYDVGEVTPNDFQDFITKQVTNNYRMGGTEYAPIINMVTKKYTEEKGDVAYVMFITDGDCSDKGKARKAITEAAKYGIFWQFIGIGNADFNFLEELDEMEGRVIDNANFFQANSISSMSDEKLYSLMMDEYPQYLVEAKQKRII